MTRAGMLSLILGAGLSTGCLVEVRTVVLEVEDDDGAQILVWLR